MIRIIENPNSLDISKLKDAIMIAFVEWSSYAISNYSNCIALLKEQSYSGEILQLNILNASFEFQIKTFKRLCEGRGEIFVVKNGQIVESYFGKDCFTNFELDIKNISDNWKG